MISENDIRKSAQQIIKYMMVEFNIMKNLDEIHQLENMTIGLINDYPPGEPESPGVPCQHGFDDNFWCVVCGKSGGAMISPTIEVLIVRDHPHRGERGYIKLINGKPVQTQGMIEIILYDCVHGTDGCFAAPGNISMTQKNRQLFAEMMKR